MDSFELRVHPDDRHLAHVFAGNGALVWGGRGVVAVVANEFAHVGPVLLLDVGAVVAVAGAGPGEGDLVGHAVVEQVVIDELGPVVHAMPMSA